MWASGAAVLVLVLVVGVIWQQTLGAQGAGTMSLAGDVRAQSVTVNSPAIVYPRIDPTIGIPSTSTPAASTSRSSSGASSRLPVVSGAVAEVFVSQGSRVTTGQPLAELDTTMLDLGVSQAKAAAKRAHTQVGVLTSMLGTISDSTGKLATAKTQLAVARAKLVTGLAQATAGRAQLVASIAALEAMLSHLPTSTPAPTSTVPPGGGTNPATLLAQLKAKLVQLDAAIALLHKAFAQLAMGKTQLATAGSQLSTARSQIETGRDVARIAAQAQDLGIEVAQVERDQARILSPVSGVVTYVLPVGSVAMVGTPLGTITPDRPTLVDTYVADSQLGAVKLGARVDVGYDSDPGAVLRGQVTTIGSASTFPPTSFPTSLIHLTRAFRVTITLDRGPAPPPGTPVDLTIDTNG
jgi:HlyD family secretion protein